MGPLFPFSRGTLMMDFMPVAMVLIAPILAFSLIQVRVKRHYQIHRRIQTGLAGLLLVAIILFELDVRLNGWRQLAEPSPYYGTSLFPVLYVHLFFSVTTTLLWLYMIITALRRSPILGGSDATTRRHRKVGRLTAIFTYSTAITGCTFYYMAFVAS